MAAARWEHMGLDEGSWRIPSPKAGEPQVMPLDDETVELLRGVERMGDWVIPGRDPAKHLPVPVPSSAVSNA